MRVMRKTLLITLICALPWSLPDAQAQGAAEAYPSRALRIISPYTPGGLSDVLIRAVAQHLTDRLGQGVVIENRPGASQQIALEAAARSAPDGHTLVMGTQSGLVLLTAARKTLPFDSLRDFASITLLYEIPLYLVVHRSEERRVGKECRSRW